MCYYLSGYINEGTDWQKFSDVYRKFIGGQEMVCYPAIKKGLIDGKNDSLAFHFGLDTYCDCGTPFGEGKITQEIRNAYTLLKDLKDCSKLRYMAILKHMYSGSFSKLEHDTEYTVQKIHIDNVDEEFLANIEDDVFYKILYYRRTW